MKIVSVKNAVGCVLAHDVTQIIKDEFKGSRFNKGHIIAPEDIPVLLSMGKEHIYVLEKNDTDVHENEAATRIACAVSGQNILLTAPKEGKVNLLSSIDGLLRVNTDMLFEVLSDPEIVLATLHKNQLVEKSQVVAGTRVIPLFVKEETVKNIENICKNKPIIYVEKLSSFKVGLISTGSEIFSNRIEDKFAPVVIEKFNKLNSEVFITKKCSDDENLITETIKEMLNAGAEMVVLTGGMSVDPDDKTPSGIRLAGGKVITYGASVLPGAMFMLSYVNNVPIVGLPGCVMYHKTSIFDLIIPRLLTHEQLTRKDFIDLAHGGLCKNCMECTFPHCSFGK